MTRNRQSGYTLVELMIALTIATLVSAGLVSVLWGAFVASSSWGPKMSSAADVRSFNQLFYRDSLMAQNVTITTPSSTPTACPVDECVTLTGQDLKNPPAPPAAPNTETLVITWCFDLAAQTLSRNTGTGCSGARTIIGDTQRHVTAFTPTKSGSAGVTIVISVTDNSGQAYTETQTLYFQPRPVQSP